MKFYLFLISFSPQLVIALVGQYKCDMCSFLTNENDCNEYWLGCEFDRQNQVCQVKPLNIDDCKYYPIQQFCDDSQGCAWNNQEQCSIFTECSNYKVNDPEQCYQKGPSCIPGNQNEDGLIICMEGNVNCQDIKEQDICWNLYYSDSSICFWDKSCVQQDISKCDTITNNKLCNQIGCTFTQGNCQQQKCDDINSQIFCTYIPISFIPWTTQICEWTQQGCKDAIDTSAFTQNNCFINTGGTYHWDQLTETCQECSGETSSQSNNDNSSKTVIIILSVCIPVVIIIIICFICVCIRKSRRNIQNRQQRIEQILNPLDVYCPNLEYQDIKDKNEIQCSICLQNFEKDSKVKVTYCQHIYHSNCLIAWMEKNKDCPLCRASLEQRILKQKNEMKQQSQK